MAYGPGSLLPRLTKFKHTTQSDCDIQPLIYLVQPQIKRISLIHSNVTERLGVIVPRLLAIHTPQLTSWQWTLAHFDWSLSTIEIFAHAVLRLTSLETCVWSTPAFALFPVWEALGSLPRLEMLGTSPNDHFLNTTISPFRARFGKGMFPNLKEFSAVVTGDDAIFLLESNIPSTLETVRLHVCTNLDTEIRRIVEHLSQNSSQLSKIVLDFVTTDHNLKMDVLQGFSSLTESWSKLKTLVIIANASLDLNDEDIRSIARTAPACD